MWGMREGRTVASRQGHGSVTMSGHVGSRFSPEHSKPVEYHYYDESGRKVASGSRSEMMRRMYRD